MVYMPKPQAKKRQQKKKNNTPQYKVHYYKFLLISLWIYLLLWNLRKSQVLKKQNEQKFLSH